MSWRETARPIIARVLQATRGQTDREIHKALRVAFPFGERSHHPYKIWLEEIKLQREARGSANLDRPRRARQSSVRQLLLREERPVSPLDDFVPRPLAPLPGARSLFD